MTKQEVAKVEETAVVPVTTEDQFMQMLERIATNPNADADKVKAFLDMKMGMLRYQAEITFKQQMQLLKAELPAVVRNKSNSQTNSKYADLEAIQKVAQPLLSKFGFFDHYEDDFPSPERVGVTCIITHKDGHESRNRVEFALDSAGIKGTVNKTPLHASASSMTYGQRLSFCRALGIQISYDDDGNAAGSNKVTEEQLKFLLGLIEETAADTKRFCEHFEIDAVSELPAAKYQVAKDQLKAKAKQAVKP